MSVDMSVYCIGDKYQEDQGQAKGGAVVKPKNGTIIYLSIKTEYVPMSLDTTID